MSEVKKDQNDESQHNSKMGKAVWFIIAVIMLTVAGGIGTTIGQKAVKLTEPAIRRVFGKEQKKDPETWQELKDRIAEENMLDEWEKKKIVVALAAAEGVKKNIKIPSRIDDITTIKDFVYDIEKGIFIYVYDIKLPVGIDFKRFKELQRSFLLKQLQSNTHNKFFSMAYGVLDARIGYEYHISGSGDIALIVLKKDEVYTIALDQLYLKKAQQEFLDRAKNKREG